MSGGIPLLCFPSPVMYTTILSVFLCFLLGPDQAERTYHRRDGAFKVKRNTHTYCTDFIIGISRPGEQDACRVSRQEACIQIIIS